MYLSKANNQTNDRDLILIKELVKNGRASYSYLAQVTGLAYTSVRERIERLINKKLLEIKPLVSPKIYGDKAAILRITTKNPEDVATILSRCNRVVSVVKTNNDIVAIVVGKTKIELIYIIEHLLRKCNHVEEFSIEYGSIPPTFMIPLKNPLVVCDNCIQKNSAKCSGCLPILRTRKL